MNKRRFAIFNPQSVILGCFALVIGAALWLTNELTKSKIENNRHHSLSNTITEVLPAHSFDNAPENTSTVIFDKINNIDRIVYSATLESQPVAVIISAIAADGYAGEIALLVAILTDGTISGVRVLHHQETPGLGDEMELRKSSWILEFNGKSITTPLRWAVKRDGGTYDQFTGATITPRAIVRAIHQTLQFFELEKSVIFSEFHGR